MRQTRWLIWGWTVILLSLSPFLWAGEEGDEEEKNAPEIEYLPIKPKLVVNLAGRRHYLSADLQLMIRGEDNLERIKKHTPLIRHTLIMLFSNLPPQQVADVSEREKLRASALQEVRKILDQYSDSEGLKDIFFTEFLVQ